MAQLDAQPVLLSSTLQDGLRRERPRDNASYLSIGAQKGPPIGVE
jgi:hypothetical protein